MDNTLNIREINETSVSCLLYVLGLVWVFPFSNIILPLILWLLLKHKYEDLELHGKNLLNFQITWGLGTFVFWLLLLFLPFHQYFILSISLSVLLPLIIATIAAVFIIISAVEAYQGDMYQFPFTYQIIK